MVKIPSDFEWNLKRQKCFLNFFVCGVEINRKDINLHKTPKLSETKQNKGNGKHENREESSAFSNSKSHYLNKLTTTTTMKAEHNWNRNAKKWEFVKLDSIEL